MFERFKRWTLQRATLASAGTLSTAQGIWLYWTVRTSTAEGMEKIDEAVQTLTDKTTLTQAESEARTIYQVIQTMHDTQSASLVIGVICGALAGTGIAMIVSAVFHKHPRTSSMQ